MFLINGLALLVGIILTTVVVLTGISACTFLVAMMKGELDVYSKKQYLKGHMASAAVSGALNGLHCFLNLMTKWGLGLPLVGLVIVAIVIFIHVVTDSMTWIILIIAVVLDIVLIWWIVKMVMKDSQ